MQNTLFSIDNGPQFVGWHNADHDWNGWVVPSFDPYAARQVVEWANSTGCEFKWTGDVLTYIEEGETFTVPRDACGRYVIGDGWVWNAAPGWMLAPILDADEAKACIRAMHESDMLFHFDDNPETIEDKHGPTFTETECGYVRQRVTELFQHLDDPHAYCVQLTNGVTDALSATLRAYCEANDLPQVSADELPPSPWRDAFIALWDVTHA